MARPTKHNLQYFPLDVTFFADHKLIMIEEDFGIKGGYLAVRLMAMVYENGYFMEWPNKFEFSCAKRVGNGFTGALVDEVLKSCLRHGLFNKDQFEKNQILTSKGIQERWMQVMIGIRRKVSILPKYSLISSEETPQSSEETTMPAAFSTQKEKKGNEKKGNKVTADEPPEPHWSLIVKCWFDFNEQKFKDRPSFDRDHPKILKRIIGRLKDRAVKKGLEWTEKIAEERFIAFLDKAFLDTWLSANFLLGNLEKQFDKIILNHNQNGTHQKTTGHHYSKPAGGKSAGAYELSKLLQAELASHIGSEDTQP